MIYIERLSSGVARVFFEKPPNYTEELFAVNELPEGEGILKVNIEGNLYRDPKPVETIDTIRAAKLDEIRIAGKAAIFAGVSVTLPSTGDIEHFALTGDDQMNITTALATVERGALDYPYHADGKMCRMYPAADIVAISQAAVRHIMYHTTYCNHLLVWAQRAESAEELEGITYGAELPEDLADNLAAVLAAAGGAM